jgi:hypothetical protein
MHSIKTTVTIIGRDLHRDTDPDQNFLESRFLTRVCGGK